ncbi:MAG: DUF4292 domain-containing protein [Bacteroidia bacterium]|nr:DUF4292 domain-containing protein [Bacteroidia bacterium]
MNRPQATNISARETGNQVISDNINFPVQTKSFSAGRKIVCCMLVVFPLLFACKSTRKVVETAPADVKLKGAGVIQVFDSMMLHQFDFEWLTAKADVDFTDKTGETHSFDVNIRMRKDSVIWLSITPMLGIEAVRILITQDSLIILDRVHREYSVRSFEYLEEVLKTPVNFEMVQAVIIGNYFPYRKSEKLKSIYEDNPFVILSTMNKRQSRRSLEEKDPAKPITQDFWIDGNYRINRSRITDDKLNRWVEATYRNFIPVAGNLYPTQLIVTISSSSPVIIKVSYSKVVSGEEISFPFTIPEKYQRK